MKVSKLAVPEPTHEPPKPKARAKLSYLSSILIFIVSIIYVSSCAVLFNTEFDQLAFFFFEPAFLLGAVSFFIIYPAISIILFLSIIVSAVKRSDNFIHYLASLGIILLSYFIGYSGMHYGCMVSA